MRGLNGLAVWVLGLYLLASPAYGETITYYVWRDDNGLLHMEDKPPKDRPYETRTIVVDTASSSPPPVSGQGGSSSREGAGRATGSSSSGQAGEPDPGTETAVADEEQRRLEEISDPGAAGADTAPGADTADPGAAAPASGAAAAGTPAAGGATAPGAAIPPAVPPAIIGP